MSPLSRAWIPPAARRVLLKLSGEMFGGGAVGLDPDRRAQGRGRDRRRRAPGRPGRHRRGRRQLLQGRGAQPARHGARAGRLHGHARHGHERARAPGLPRAGGGRDARADGHHDGPGRRAVHSVARDPAPGEGSRRDLRRGRGNALLLDGHRVGAARPRDRGAPRSSSARTASTRSTRPTRARTPPPSGSST